jgi:hypothetical protein
MTSVTRKTTPAAALAACAVAVAGCAFPLASSRPAPPPRAHAPAPTRAPGPSFAAVVADAENCAAGADFPGHSRRTRDRDFGACLGIDDVPAAAAVCAVRVFRLVYRQGAEAVALAVRAECKSAITERK